jgi:hypothetical protein
MTNRIMPRDVTTRWNSTYDMLNFALEYRKAVDILTADRKNELREYELSEREWTIAGQLCDILKVSDVRSDQSRGMLSHVMLRPMHRS